MAAHILRDDSLVFILKSNIVIHCHIRLKVAILVRGSVRLLVVCVDVGPVVLLLPALVVGEGLPVAVLHHLTLGQVRASFDKLGKPKIDNNL